MDYSLTHQIQNPNYDQKQFIPLSTTSLHSIRKPPSKPWRRPAHNLPPPPKVYRVDPHGFRGLVQRLTGNPNSIKKTSRPSPVNVERQQQQQLLLSQLQPRPPPPPPPSDQYLSTGLSLSPSTYSSWSSFPLLSPAGFMAALDS